MFGGSHCDAVNVETAAVEKGRNPLQYTRMVIDQDRNSMVVQIVGDTEKIEAMIELLHPYGILEISRTGVTAIARGRNRL